MNKVINIVSVKNIDGKFGPFKGCKGDDNKDYTISPASKKGPNAAYTVIEGAGTYDVFLGENGKSIWGAKKVDGTTPSPLPKVDAPVSAPRQATQTPKTDPVQNSIDNCNSLNIAGGMVEAIIKKSDHQWKFIKDTDGKVIGHEATELARYLAKECRDMKKHNFVDAHTQGILDEFEGSKVVEK